MRKFLWLLAVVMLAVACERDDLCLTKPAVPLNVAFADDTTEEPKALELTVLVDGDTLVPWQVSDTLALPLPVKGDSIRYLFVKRDSLTENADEIKVFFTPRDTFVSKACGFITVYENVDVQPVNDADVWIKRVELLENKCVTDTITHVKIYH